MPYFFQCVFVDYGNAVLKPHLFHKFSKYMFELFFHASVRRKNARKVSYF